MMGMPATGKRVECETMGMHCFADGKVAERWGVADNMTVMQQLGLFGRPGTARAALGARSDADTARSDRGPPRATST